MKHLAAYVGGKTGTTDNENDAWFVGFTSDVTVVVWVGYDNARGKQTLGRGGTGGQHRRADRRADHPGDLELVQRRRRRCRRRRRKPPDASRRCRSTYTSGQKLAGQQPRRFHRVFPARRHKKAARHSISRWPERGSVTGRASEAGARTARRRTIDGRRNTRRCPPARLNPMDRVPRTLRELFGL